MSPLWALESHTIVPPNLSMEDSTCGSSSQQILDSDDLRRKLDAAIILNCWRPLLLCKALCSEHGKFWIVTIFGENSSQSDQTGKYFSEGFCHVRVWRKGLGVLRLVRGGSSFYYLVLSCPLSQ